MNPVLSALKLLPREPDKQGTEQPPSESARRRAEGGQGKPSGKVASELGPGGGAPEARRSGRGRLVQRHRGGETRTLQRGRRAGPLGLWVERPECQVEPAEESGLQRAAGARRRVPWTRP